MFKKILVGLVVVLIVVVAIGLLLPRNSHVERSVTIDRPASMVFATVNSFQLFSRWSPWQDLDPNMHQSTAGPREGVGAKLQAMHDTMLFPPELGTMHPPTFSPCRADQHHGESVSRLSSDATPRRQPQSLSACHCTDSTCGWLIVYPLPH